MRRQTSISQASGDGGSISTSPGRLFVSPQKQHPGLRTTRTAATPLIAFRAGHGRVWTHQSLFPLDVSQATWKRGVRERTPSTKNTSMVIGGRAALRGARAVIELAMVLEKPNGEPTAYVRSLIPCSVKIYLDRPRYPAIGPYDSRGVYGRRGCGLWDIAGMLRMGAG